MMFATPTPPTSSATAPRPRNSAGERALRLRAGLERGGGPADVDLARGARGRRSRRARAAPPRRPRCARARRPRWDGRRSPGGVSAASKPTRTERSISGASATGPRIPTTVEPVPAEPDALGPGHAVDAEPAGRVRAEHGSRLRARSRRSGSGPARRRADGGQQVELARPGPQAAGLDRRDQRAAVHGRADARGRRYPLDRGRSGRSSPAPTPGSCAVPPIRLSPVSTVSRLVPRRSISASSPAWLDAERPRTATIARDADGDAERRQRGPQPPGPQADARHRAGRRPGAAGGASVVAHGRRLLVRDDPAVAASRSGAAARRRARGRG